MLDSLSMEPMYLFQLSPMLIAPSCRGDTCTPALGDNTLYRPSLVGGDGAGSQRDITRESFQVEESRECSCCNDPLQVGMSFYTSNPCYIHQENKSFQPMLCIQVVISKIGTRGAIITPVITYPYIPHTYHRRVSELLNFLYASDRLYQNFSYCNVV